jgi:hypothetical protein
MENRVRFIRILLWSLGLALLFALYTSGLSQNPPGFYMDESCTAYNAYLVAKTGAGESGQRFPVFFEVYAGMYTQYYHPVEIYLLALVFLVVPPSILIARMFAAFWMFAACLLLGLLAKQISGRRTIGAIVAVTALLTPWLVDIGRLVWEVHLVPVCTVTFLLAVYHAHRKERWSFLDITLLVLPLALLTYCYASGRVLGPLMAAGLVFFAVTRQRLVAITATWALYAITFLPMFLFSRNHPGALTKRFHEITYIQSGAPWTATASEFVRRYLEDQGLTNLLMTGDVHPRHHVPDSGGALFFATFILALIGLAIVIPRLRRDPWWRFVLYGLAASIVPGAISAWAFHSLRLLAYPVFLLLLIIPALEWLLAGGKDHERAAARLLDEAMEPSSENRERFRPGVVAAVWTRPTRLAILGALLALTVAEAVHFQTIFRRVGPQREIQFDAAYKRIYDTATGQSARPIYLEDGFWGPGYIHALWYATVEKRPLSEFVHLPAGAKPPSGAVVISSERDCQHCTALNRAGLFFVYKVL